MFFASCQECEQLLDDAVRAAKVNSAAASKLGMVAGTNMPETFNALRRETSETRQQARLAWERYQAHVKAHGC
jgi:hypothetical protein